MKSHRLAPVLSLLFLCALTAVVRSDDTARVATSDASAKEVRQWEVTGPWGGDVRTLVASASDTDLLYLGTADGQMFRSTDGARSWQRLKPGLEKRGLSIDHIVIDPRDPKTVYAGAWAVARDEEGGVFKSNDGGEHWKLLDSTKKMSVRSLALAPSDSNFLIAGSANDDPNLNGVFRSKDAGKNWERISPVGDKEIRNIQSVAVDPRDTNVIYVGTWHLPWKTTDGGASWKQTGYKAVGMIDDSDIFGISVNPVNPDLVFVNACSGIYRSASRGEKWLKVPGIPFSARRTYKLLVHPTNPKVIFAGTSEGLWRSKDDGKKWMLLTSKSLVIRSIVITPDKPDRVMIATDDSGIRVSENLGDDFRESNSGFIHRHVLAIMPDPTERGRLLASVFHDSSGGSVFASSDSGESWRSSSTGLGGRDVFAFYQMPGTSNVIYAGTNNGVYRSNDRGATWSFTGVDHPLKPDKPVKAPVRNTRSTRSRRRAEVNWSPTSVGRFETVAATQQTLSKNSKKPASKHSSKKTKGTNSAAKKETSAAGSTSASKRHSTKKGTPKVATSPSKKQPAKTEKPLIGTSPSQVRPARSGRPPVATSSVQRTPVKKEKPVVATSLAPGFVELTKEVDDITSFADGEGHVVLLAATMDGLYRTFDETRGWSKVYINGYDPAGRVFSVSTHKDTPRKIFAGTRQGLFISNDGGESWQHVTRGPSDVTVKAIAQDPRDAQLVIVGTNQYIFRSTNGGRTWDRRGGGLPSGDFTSVVINSNNPDEVMASEYSNGGVFRSIDKGYTWERVDVELPSNRVWTLNFDPFDRDRAYWGSFSSGVYVYTVQHRATLPSQQ